MIPVTNSLRLACNSDSLVYKEYIIVDSVTVEVKAKMSNTCYSNGNFIGTFNMKSLSFTTQNDIEYKKKVFEYYKSVNGESFKIGFYIVTDVTINDSDETVTVTAMDYALKFAQPYVTELDYASGTVTLFNVLEEVCTNVGVTLKNTSITNGSFIVDSNQFVNGEQYGNVIANIAGMSCDFATITEDDKLEFVFKKDTSEIIEDYINLNDKRDTLPITSVSIGTSQVVGQEAILRDLDLIELYGEHWLVLNDNLFSYTLEKRQALVTEIFDKIKGFGYSSFESEYAFKPYLQLGDKIQFKNKSGVLVDSIVLKIDTDYDNVKLSAPSVIKATVDYENSPSPTEIAKMAEIIANKANATITSTVSTVETIQNAQSGMLNDLNTVNQTLSTMSQTILEQTSTEFNMWFEQTGLQNTVNAVQDLANSNNSNLTTLNEYIKFVEGQIELGRSDSQVQLVIKNDRISFMTGTSESAHISNNTLYITDSTILVKQQIGSWLTVQDEYGNLNTKWIGGA